MKRNILNVNLLALFVVTVLWVNPILGAMAEFVLGVVQVISLILLVTKWNSFNSKLKNLIRLYLIFVLVYGIICFIIYLFISETLADSRIQNFPVSASFIVMGLPYLIAIFFTRLCFLSYKYDKSVLSKLETDTLDAEFLHSDK